MDKVFYLGLACCLLLFSCKPKEKIIVFKSFSAADSFSPGIAKTGDTVSIIGTGLKDSKVILDNIEIPLVLNESEILRFVVNDEMTKNKSVYTLKVKFLNGSGTIFSQPIVLNHIVRIEDLTWLSTFSGNKTIGDTLGTGPSQLLLTDFDGHGVRTSNATGNFDKTQWISLVKTGGSQLITSSFLGVANPPSKNNFYAIQLNPEFIENGSAGFVGEFVSASSSLNDKKNPWPSNFSEIQGSPIIIPTSNKGTINSLGQIYLNFFLYKNRKSKGIIRPYLYNDQLADFQSFAYNIPYSQGNEEWSLVSIPMSKMRKEYGFNETMNYDDYVNLNKLKFSFANLEKANETSQGSNGWITAVEDVQFYIDHIIITQGGAYLSPPIN